LKNNEAIDNKKQELKNIVLEKIDTKLINLEDLSIKVIDNFVDITPPEEPERSMSFLTLNPSGTLISTKPGNITLNWKKLITKLPTIIPTTAKLIENPWMISLAALYIWSNIFEYSKIDLDFFHSVVVLKMWENRDHNNKILEDEAFEKTNNYLKQNESSELDRIKFAKIINDLEKMKCIEVNDGIILLREWIKTDYK
jgi:hypothetical protein